jgi:hypothetical protein
MSTVFKVNFRVRYREENKNNKGITHEMRNVQKIL